MSLSKNNLQDLFMELAKISSPSFSETLIFDFIERKLKNKNLNILRLPYDHQGRFAENMFIRLKATDSSKKGLFFDAHADTVKPCENIQPVLEDGVIRSHGETILGADDKAGIAAIIGAIEEILNSGIKHGELVFLISSAEEEGLIGSRYVPLSLFEGINYGIILDGEGPVGIINLQAAYHYSYDISVLGKAAHAGIEPEKGTNAIKISADLIRELPSGRISKDTVANVACISGGSGRNIVPDRVVINGEFRSLIEEDCKEIKKLIEQVIARFKDEGHIIEYKIVRENLGYHFEKDSDFVQWISQSMEKLGIFPKYESSCGGTNANIYVEKGLPCLVLSVGMENIHSVDEFLRVEDLYKASNLILQIIKDS